MLADIVFKWCVYPNRFFEKLFFLMFQSSLFFPSFHQNRFSCVLSGIDKITEKSQVSEDGTMVAVPQSDSPQTTADNGATAGASDTESNSDRDHEVRS